VNDSQRQKLRFIRERYGALIQASATHHGHRPAVVAGIMMRETEGGLSPACNPPGPACLGDGGHGHGLMQIDDRSFADYCASQHWKDPASNIDFGCAVLATKRAYLVSHLYLLAYVAEHAAIAAYNCGEGNVRKALEASQDVDVYTANHDYSRCVLEFAQAYQELLAPPAPAPAPDSEPPQAAAIGIWATLFDWLLKIFVKRNQA
jgi:hypothetical protein